MVQFGEPYGMQATPGGQLSQENIVGRDERVASLWMQAESASLLMSDMRRLGKSSVLTLMTIQQPPGWECIKVSLQGVGTTVEFATKLLAQVRQFQGLPKRAVEALKGFLSALDIKADAGPVSVSLSPAFRDVPLDALEAALAKVADVLNDQGLRLLLACDEVPDMLLTIADTEGPDAAKRVLAVLRRFRDGPVNTPIRWLLTGSVGVHHVLRRIGAGDDLVNDLDFVPLGPLDEDWSTWLAECLLLGADLGYDPETPAEIARITDGIPYLAHLLVAYARDDPKRGHLSPGDASEVFDLAGADLDLSRQSTHLLTRIDPHYGDDAETARWVLDQVAGCAQSREMLATAAAWGAPGAVTETQLRLILDLLVLDHYLHRDPAGVYEWRYRSLARIWKIRRA